MIPDDVITQIRDAADIVAVIGQHVQLRRAGRSWKGLCPFHGEKTPSFNVIPDKGFFNCFGCQKHGDVFTFVMEMEGKSFVEAAEELANRYGIAVPRIEENPELRRARGERAAMLELNKVATAFYREMLADPKRGEPGRAYLEKRGVSQATSDKFQLGYAPPDWALLADHLKARRADLELAVKIGLVAPRPRQGGYYDRNRDRLVCPVIVPGGDVVGFSSRVVSSPPPGEDGPPKYINSPESPIYKKSKLLFGLAQAREAMAAKKRAVLVEGNFDVITLHQAEFGEVIAPLGTALTAEQIGILKRVTERVVLLYDGDRAGYKATMHALQLCVEAELEVLVASRPGHARSGGAGPLSGGVDPDSLVASGGAELLKEAIDRAQGGIEFFAFEVWSKARNNADARTRALEDAARLVTKVASPTKRDLIVGTLATAMDVDIAVVRNAIARASGSSGPPERHDALAQLRAVEGRGDFRGRDGERGGNRFGGGGGGGGNRFGDGAAGNRGNWPSGGNGRSNGNSRFGDGASSGNRFGGGNGGNRFGRDRGNGRGNQRPGEEFLRNGTGMLRTSNAPDGDPPRRSAAPGPAASSAAPTPAPHREDDEGMLDMPPPDDYMGPDPRDEMSGPDPRDERAAAPADARPRPNAPDRPVAPRESEPKRHQGAPPTEEVELLALFADHPSLMATAEAHKAFCLLTDGRLQAMYSAAQREGRTLVELAPVHLPPTTAMLVLSGKYAEAKDPRGALSSMIGNFETRRLAADLEQTKARMRDAQRRGERELARLFAQLAMAQRSGDRELIARITDEISSNRKQVD